MSILLSCQEVSFRCNQNARYHHGNVFGREFLEIFIRQTMIYNLWFISPFPPNLRIENKIHFPWPLTLAVTGVSAQIFIWRRLFAMIFRWSFLTRYLQTKLKPKMSVWIQTIFFLNSHRFYFNRGNINLTAVKLNDDEKMTPCTVS